MDYIEDSENTTVVPVCYSPYYPNVTFVECLSSLYWGTFNCSAGKNCTAPALENGNYSNSAGDVVSAGATVVIGQELTPTCDSKHNLTSSDVLLCLGSGVFLGDVACLKERDSCSTLNSTNSLECSLNSTLDLYTCTMTCSDGYVTSSDSESSQTVSCNYTTETWSHETNGNTDLDNCTADTSCTVPELTNGYYSNSDGTVLSTGGSVVTDQVLTPSCDDNHGLGGSHTITCNSTGNYTGTEPTCTKSKDSCPQPASTTNPVVCAMGDLYDCTMTCSDSYYIISDGALTSSQIIVCNYTTEVWSYGEEGSWDTCLEESDPASIVLSSTMYFSGGTCPSVTSLDAALGVWLTAQTSSSYGCYQNGSCSLADGSSCSDDGSDTIGYVVKINQTLETSSNYMTAFGTKLVEDATANNITLSTTSDRKRATTTFTSDSATAATSVTCAAGAQNVNGTCVKCSKGYYESNDVCTICSVGTYSDSTGSSQCTDCDSGKSTASTGSDSASDCKATCSVPDLDNGSSSPAESSTTFTSTTVTVTCDNNYDTGYNNVSQYTCQDSYQCYAKCELPTISSHQSYSDSLTAGTYVSYGRTVTVTCADSQSSLKCLGDTLTAQDCTSSIEVTGVEDIKSGTAATLSCQISVISSSVNITWHTSDGSAITSSSSYLINDGDFGDYTQSSTMTISGGNTGSDASYKCKASSLSLDADVTVDVFDISGKGASVASGSAATLSCSITGATKQLPVTWESSETTISSANGVTVSPGAYSSGSQIATLVVSSATEDKTYTCYVDASDGSTPHVQVTLTVSGSDSGGGGGMIGIIAGVVAVLLLAVVAMGCYCFKKKKRAKLDEEIYMNQLSDSSQSA